MPPMNTNCKPFAILRNITFTRWRNARLSVLSYVLKVASSFLEGLTCCLFNLWSLYAISKAVKAMMVVTNHCQCSINQSIGYPHISFVYLRLKMVAKFMRFVVISGNIDDIIGELAVS